MCPERTVKCPYLDCNEKVQVREFRKHVMAVGNECTYYNSDTLKEKLMYTGIATKKGEWGLNKTH